MGLSRKILLAKLERSGSLNRLIWLFFAFLTALVLLLLFYDSIIGQNKFETEYGQYEGKNQSIYLEK